MILPYEQLLAIIIKECNLRRNTMFIFFAVISLTLLVVGKDWPKKYTSDTIIHIDNSNILQPLMRGAAVSTRAIDHVATAKEIIFGEKIMNQLILDADWLDKKLSDVDREILKKDIVKSVKLQGVGKDLLKIKYTHSDPMRAYLVTKRLTELYIEEGGKAKIEESKSAYDFISNQVNEYLIKLTTVEEELRAFRSNNPDARPGLENEVSGAITRLQRDIEKAKLQLQETHIKKISLEKQLSGEAAITISQSKQGLYRSKIADFQARLETLRLDYKETYPDILRLKHQINDLKQSLNEEITKRELAKKQARSTGNQYIDESIILSPLYQQLRSNVSATETEVATLDARIKALEKNLKNEYNRARKIFGGEAKLTKLTRNYEVNQEIYQDLLRRLQNARVSKKIDEQQKGVTYKIQEAAKIPLLPAGARFLHFALAGLILGILVPVGFIYFLIQFDPRVRFSQIISNELNIPVLVEINKYITPEQERKNRVNAVIISIGVIFVISIYGYIGWMKYTENLS
jgi:polysaccharide chain length determinant protein (PEP-CTERM system associated)